MPKVDAAKIKLAPRNKRRLLFLLLVVTPLFCLLAPSIFYRPATAWLKVDHQTVSLDIAASETARQKGLGGRSALAPNKGMLFVLGQTRTATCIWMKDMRFSLDAIWLTAAKTVTDSQQNISPQSYPKIYCPKTPGRYIIELPAGQLARLHIQPNQTLNF